MHDTEPPTTRRLLAQIAAALDVPIARFARPDRPEPGPTLAECEEVAMLFCRIASPARRAAVLKLLREMAAAS